jgi:type VI secretion system protein
MQNLSLYDLLIGQFVSESTNPDDIGDQYFDQLNEDEKLRYSIIENLRLLLSTRQGSVQHLPHFGMPDILQIYFDTGSIEEIKKEIINVILTYEPRIGSVQIQKSDFDQNNMRLSLKIAASIKDVKDKQILLTEFSTTGWTKVMFDKDAK